MSINQLDGLTAEPATHGVPVNGAFSGMMPNLQLSWDASSLKNIQFCPRYYQMNNLQGWQAPSVDLNFGRYIADGFERFQKARLDGKSREDAILVAIRAALEDTYFEGVAEHEEGHGWHDATPDIQWGGRYETMWKCEGTEKYKNAKGNRAVCPFAHKAAWFPGDAPDICTECRSGIHVERRYIPEDTAKNRQTLIRALIWYGLDQPEDITEGYRPYVFPNGTPAVELSGKLPLPLKSVTGEDFLLTWNFDYIGVWGDEHFITDNKTTRKTLNSQFFDTYSPDTQFDTYGMVGTIAYPDLNIKGVMVDAVQVMVGGIEFGRHPYYKQESQHEEHLRDLQFWVEQAQAFAVADYWPMNKRSCWLCPFKQVCSQPPERREGYLQSNFKKGPRWDPSHER